jgi:hypothetical protein
LKTPVSLPSPKHSTGLNEPGQRTVPDELVRIDAGEQHPVLQESFAANPRKAVSPTEEIAISSAPLSAPPESTSSSEIHGAGPLGLRQSPTEPNRNARIIAGAKDARLEDGSFAAAPDRRVDKRVQQASELSPRPLVAIPILEHNTRRETSESRLFIGQLSVEIVPAAPAVTRPAPPRQALSRPTMALRAGIVGRRLKARFGLGQV